MQLVAAEEAASQRFFMNLPNGIGNWVTSFMGVTAAEARARSITDASALAPGPVAYLVEQPAHSTIAGHFHQVDQFQVFVAGSGSFGSRKLEGLHLHYAAAFTPYAPISAGDAAVHYFTLRRGFDPGAQWMPESKQFLFAQHRASRAAIATLAAVAPGSLHEPAFETVIQPDGSGLAAWRIGLGAGQRMSTPPADGGGGQFLLVLAGSGVLDVHPVQRHAVAHLAPDDPPVVLVAAKQGLDALLVQFASVPGQLQGGS